MQEGRDEGIERSPHGGEILRHEPIKRPHRPPPKCGDALEKLPEHLARYGLEVETVWHEVVSDLVHLDVHICPPSEQRPHYTLFTTGMSDLPMATPEGFDDHRYAELIIGLPADWPIHDEGAFWPVQVMKTLARLPHEYDTWLGLGHTIPNGDPAVPYADETEFSCAMVWVPQIVPLEACRIPLATGKEVNLFSVLFLHPTEMELKLHRGADALCDRLARAGIAEVLDPARKSVWRRKRFGLF